MTVNAYKDRIRKQGPCRLCGGPYAAHRIIDGMLERIAAGEPVDEVTADYDLMVDQFAEYVLALLDLLDEKLVDVGGASHE